MTHITTLPPRSDVPVEETWALESIYAAPTDWEAACAELAAGLPADRIVTVFGRVGANRDGHAWVAWRRLSAAGGCAFWT